MRRRALATKTADLMYIPLLPSPAAVHVTQHLRRCLWTPPAIGTDSFQARGTKYEKHVKPVLEQFLRFEGLRHIGGRSDKGIDFLGKWRIPEVSIDRNVIIQCKYVKKKTQPSLIREFEGALLGRGQEIEDALGVFVATTYPTAECFERINSSQFWLLYLTVHEKGAITGAFPSFNFKRSFPGFISAISRSAQPDARYDAHHLEFFYDHCRLTRS